MMQHCEEMKEDNDPVYLRQSDVTSFSRSYWRCEIHSPRETPQTVFPGLCKVKECDINSFCVFNYLWKETK